MKKIAISFLALAALSTASFASSGNAAGKQDNEAPTVSAQAETYSAQNALAVPTVSTGKLTAFERMKKIMKENSVSHH